MCKVRSERKPAKFEVLILEDYTCYYAKVGNTNVLYVIHKDLRKEVTCRGKDSSCPREPKITL